MAENTRVRYSDAELAEFKALILEKLAVARSDYEQLRASITRSADNDTEDTSPTFKVLEEGAMTLSKEEIERLAAHQLKFIKNLAQCCIVIFTMFFVVSIIFSEGTYCGLFISVTFLPFTNRGDF